MHSVYHDESHLFFKFFGESHCYGFFFSSHQLNLSLYHHFFQEQGRHNDLLSNYDGPVPQDDRHDILNSTKAMRSLLSTPGFSTNFKSDSVHCNPLLCMASGSRCHTADYLKEMKDMDSSVQD